MNPSAIDRIAVHSTHEAAEKIAGIGAVLDGILPQQNYRQAFPKNLLVGPYPFPEGRHPLGEVFFDSAIEGPQAQELIPQTVKDRLTEVSRQFGTRIVFGRRKVGTKGAEAVVDVLLASPSGIKRSKIEAFRQAVRERFQFDLTWFEDHYRALQTTPDTSLDRILRFAEQLVPGAPAAAYPGWLEPEQALLDHRGNTIYGGVPFAAGSGPEAWDHRASFPPIRALDSFSGFEKTSSYLVELEFYFYAAAVLWQATKALVEQYYRPADMVLFAHDWIGVPLYWAMKTDGNLRLQGATKSATTVYFAHEARIARMLVEGTVKDKMHLLRPRCHPDGHDVAFYAYLAGLESAQPPASIEQAFPETWSPAGGRAFSDIYHHELNRQAGSFNVVVAVGKHVERETELILRGRPGVPKVALCPNGIPDFLAGALPAGAKSGERARLQEESRERLRDFTEARFGFRPDYIFTGVNRCELSKAPWRNVNFFRAFVDAPENRETKAIFIWLSRPRPLPTPQETARWGEWGWPVEHRPAERGGDLRPEECLLWEMIRRFNAEHEGRARILYVNQFGWSKERLGSMDPLKSTFIDLRVGTDVEIGLSIYEPFGIAPLEPFASGAICVLSDACGCAVHLEELQKRGLIADDGFVIGRFASRKVDPSQVDLRRLYEIEEEVYREMTQEILAKSRRTRADRIASAVAAMPQLSWARAADYLLEATGLKHG